MAGEYHFGAVTCDYVQVRRRAPHPDFDQARGSQAQMMRPGYLCNFSYSCMTNGQVEKRLDVSGRLVEDSGSTARRTTRTDRAAGRRGAVRICSHREVTTGRTDRC